jgi:hypothetical protein
MREYVASGDIFRYIRRKSNGRDGRNISDGWIFARTPGIKVARTSKKYEDAYERAPAALGRGDCFVA